MDDESKQMLQKCLLAQDWHWYFLTLIYKWQGMTLKEVAKAAEPDSILFGTPPATIRLSSFPHSDLSQTSLSQPSDLFSHRKKPFNHHHSLLSCMFGEILHSDCAITQVLIGNTALHAA
ncbi:hypothetical protein V8B97DRAFT_2022220 [Scleroderma yunnanense]